MGGGRGLRWDRWGGWWGGCGVGGGVWMGREFVGG